MKKLIYTFGMALVLLIAVSCEKNKEVKQSETVGVIVAMEDEYALMKSTLSEVEVDGDEICVGYSSGKKVVLAKCGIGKVNATITTISLINDYSPSYIINTGVAGGVENSIEVGDIVVGTQTCYHDFDIKGVVSYNKKKSVC